MSGVTVLVVVVGLEVGGTERHLAAVLPRLAARGYRIDVFSINGRGPVARELEETGITVIAPGPADRASGFIRSAALLWRELRRKRPDIVHFFLPQAYLVGGLCSILAGVRHRVMSRRSLNLYQRRHPILARLERRLHGRMSALVGNSDAIVGELRREGASPERVHLIRNGVDLRAFAAPRSPLPARIELGLSESALVFVTVANLIPYKGHAELLAALGQVKDRLPPGWCLLAAGRDEGIGPALRQRATMLGLSPNVRWLGSRDDVPRLLAAADLALLCSHEEGFPNAILEAMAAGLPVIATRVGGSAEAVVDGLTGLLVPPNDVDRLAEAITVLAGDPARRAAMGEAGRRRAEDEFSLDRCVEGYHALYATLLDRASVGFSR